MSSVLVVLQGFHVVEHSYVISPSCVSAYAATWFIEQVFIRSVGLRIRLLLHDYAVLSVMWTRIEVLNMGPVAVSRQARLSVALDTSDIRYLSGRGGRAQNR